MQVRANALIKVTLISIFPVIIRRWIRGSWLQVCQMISRHMPGLGIIRKLSMRTTSVNRKAVSAASLRALKQIHRYRWVRSKLWMCRRRSQHRHSQLQTWHWRRQKSPRVASIGATTVAINLDKASKVIEHKRPHTRSLLIAENWRIGSHTMLKLVIQVALR